MKATSIDRRSLLKLALAGVAVPALAPADAALASAANPAAPEQSFVAPAMCPDLHIAESDGSL